THRPRSGWPAAAWSGPECGTQFQRQSSPRPPLSNMENEYPPAPSGRPAAVDLVSERARSIGQIMVPYGPRAVTWGAIDPEASSAGPLPESAAQTKRMA